MKYLRAKGWHIVQISQIEGPNGQWEARVKTIGQIGGASPEKALEAARAKWPLIPRAQLAIEHKGE